MHLYTQNSFTEQQLSLMKSIDKPVTSGMVENFLSQQEYNLLRNMVVNLKDYPEVGSVSKYYGSSYNDPIGKEIEKICASKLQNLIGDHTVDFFAFQEAINPWKIHADARWYSDKTPQYTVVIPLDVCSDESEWKSTYSFTFHQKEYRYKMPNNDQKKSGNNQDSWKRPCDNPNVTQLVQGYNISKDLYEKHFSHMDYEFLEGLTIEGMYEWKPRSVIYWSQCQMHCASNFLAENISTKRSLIFMTNFKS